MNKTKIKWTDYTWNPISGCDKISDGCKYCYAGTIAERYKGGVAFPNGFEVHLKPGKLKEPYKIKTPSKIFINSMSDLFHEGVPVDYIRLIINIVLDNPQHQFQILTKRAKRMRDVSKDIEFPENLWCGVSVESNKYLSRIDCLRDTEAKIKFVSFEPLLEDVSPVNLDGINWVVTGGESGLHLFDEKIAGERALVIRAGKEWIVSASKIDWVRKIRDNCLKNNVAFYHKQWGGPQPASAGNELDGEIWEEFPMLLSTIES